MPGDSDRWAVRFRHSRHEPGQVGFRSRELAERLLRYWARQGFATYLLELVDGKWEERGSWEDWRTWDENPIEGEDKPTMDFARPIQKQTRP